VNGIIFLISFSACLLVCRTATDIYVNFIFCCHFLMALSFCFCDACFFCNPYLLSYFSNGIYGFPSLLCVGFLYVASAVLVCGLNFFF
jgi:hypothetical protein